MQKPTAYPYTAWVLQPSFKPKEVTFVEPHKGWAGTDYGCKSQSGRVYRRAEIHISKQDAINFGISEVVRMQSDLYKKQASIDKKRAELDKAST